jgi:hypothetical protein
MITKSLPYKVFQIENFTVAHDARLELIANKMLIFKCGSIPNGAYAPSINRFDFDIIGKAVIEFDTIKIQPFSVMGTVKALRWTT